MKRTAILVFSAFLTLGIVLSPLSQTVRAVDRKSVSSGTGIDDAYQQTIIEFLMPQIDQAVDTYYRKYLNDLPGVAPYFGGKVLRIAHRDSEPAKNIPYSYMVVVQVMPYFGPHITVGMDNLTFRVFAGGKAQLEKFEHIESYEIPPNYRDAIIGKWPPEK